MEPASYLLFLSLASCFAILFKSAFGDRQEVFLLLSLFLYGMLLEYLAIEFFGSYSYSEDFLLNLGNVPITIGLLWSIVIFSGLKTSDKITEGLFEKSLYVSGLGIATDLMIEWSAVLSGLWAWNHPTFMVNPGNFFAWIAAPFLFTFTWESWKNLIGESRLKIAVIPILSSSLLVVFLSLWIKVFAELRAIGIPEGAEYFSALTLSILISFHAIYKLDFRSKDALKYLIPLYITTLSFQLILLIKTELSRYKVILPFLILNLYLIHKFSKLNLISISQPKK